RHRLGTDGRRGAAPGVRRGGRNLVARGSVPPRHRRGRVTALPGAERTALALSSSGANPCGDERALDAARRLTATRGGDAALTAERLPALAASTGGALVPVLRARAQADARELPAVHGRPSRWLDPLPAGAGRVRLRLPDRLLQCRPGGTPP